MAGRNASEAVRAFIDPIRQALGCIGVANVIGSKGYLTPRLGEKHRWLANGGAGVRLRCPERSTLAPGTFFAAMWWHLIEDDRPEYGPYRVTTDGYDYSLVSPTNAELWAFHWHPAGQSDVTGPHMHLGDAVLQAGVLVSAANHLPTSRFTVENAIRWAINWGAVPAEDDWEDRLALAESPHLLYRKWAAIPPTSNAERDS